MYKFILISFGLLGFAFYELSGGNDFDGEALRLSRVDAAPVGEQAVPTLLAQAPQVNTPEVTRDSVDLISLEIEPAAAQIIQASLVVEQDTAPVVLPSIVDQLPAASYDIRSVTSNRVNVRGGPSTSFDVVGKLVRGAEVEVLTDTGNGWVEMQSLDGSTIGWMADFLLSKS